MFIMIGNENLILKDFSFFVHKWNKDMGKGKKNLELNKKQVIGLIEKITKKKINDLSIESGGLDFPANINTIKIGRIDIKIIENNKISIIKNNESELILYEILTLYQEQNKKLTQRKIFSLINRKKINIKVQNINLIPKIIVNNVNITQVL